jgi:putative ABC transport system permease protein
MIKLAFKNLLRSSLRNLFTLSGVAVSIALFVSLMSITSSLKKQIDQSMILSKVDLVVQEKGAATPAASRLPENMIQKLKKMPKIKSVSPVIIGSTSVSGQHARLPYLFIFGISPQEPEFSLTQWVKSGMIDGQMFRSEKKEVLIGQLTALRLQIKVGDTLTLGNNEQYSVSGIYWLEQGILDGGAILNLRNSQELLKRKGYINMALVGARNKQDITPLLAHIPDKFSGVSTLLSQSLRKQVRAVTMIDSFINAVSTAAMFLGGLLVLNTLLMAVSERTREIGMLMAIGWSRGMIMSLIIIEAFILSIAGGILGYILAFPALQGLAMLPSTGPGWIPPSPSAELFVAAIGAAILMGGISSLYPAIWATRMKPAAALRYE